MVTARRARKSVYVQKWKKSNPDKVAKNDRKYKLKILYGITPEQYDEMLLLQGGVCKLCGQINRNGKHLHVDHNHETGEIRGLLCGRCNLAIGQLGDTIENLCGIVKYLGGRCDSDG